MGGGGPLWYAKAALRDRVAFQVVSQLVHEEVSVGGKRFSDRQRQLTEEKQVDFMPNFAGLAVGCPSILALRGVGFMKKYPRIMILLPALPFYVVPYQMVYHAREAAYLLEMMREAKSSKFAGRLRKAFESSATM